MDKKPIVIVRSTTPPEKDLVFPREFALALAKFYSLTGGLPDKVKATPDATLKNDLRKSK